AQEDIAQFALLTQISGDGGGLAVKIGAVIIVSDNLLQPLTAGLQPREIVPQPCFQPVAVLAAEGAGLFEKTHRIEEIVEVLELDNAGLVTLIVIVAATYLRIAEMRVHARGRIEEPCLDEFRTMGGEILATSHVRAKR